MKNLNEVCENSYVSVNTFDAEDSKPFKVSEYGLAAPLDNYLVSKTQNKMKAFLKTFFDFETPGNFPGHYY